MLFFHYHYQDSFNRCNVYLLGKTCRESEIHLEAPTFTTADFTDFIELIYFAWLLCTIFSFSHSTFIVLFDFIVLFVDVYF